MRRTKEWWARLTADERSRLYWLEEGERHGGSGWNLPEGFSDCGFCSTPTRWGGLCAACSAKLGVLLDKADGIGQVAAFPLPDHQPRGHAWWSPDIVRSWKQL